MSYIVVHVKQAKPLPKVPTYVGRCCREWILAVGYRGKCGFCGEAPKYVRPDDGGPVNEA